MMDREKVISDIEEQIAWIRDNDFHKFPGWGHTVLAMKDAVALLKEQEAQKWNLLTEDADGIIHGLPGDDGQYLMTDGKNIWIDDYVDGVDDGIFLDSGTDLREIKAWMYMPELPKQEGR